MPYSIGFENNQKYILENRIPTVCSLEDWAKWFESNSASRIVGRAKGENIEVLTSFIGLSYGWDLYDRLLVFELLVLDRTKEIERLYFATWELAEKEHSRICQFYSLDSD